MAQHIYPARVYRSDTTGEFSVMFPDVDGCVSAGADLNACLVNAAQALAGHFALMIDEGDEIPEPSDLLARVAEQPNLDAEDQQGLIGVFPVTANLPGKAIRLSISMDEELVRMIDAAAGPMKRSQFLATAAREKLAAAPAAPRDLPVLDLKGGRLAPTVLAGYPPGQRGVRIEKFAPNGPVFSTSGVVKMEKTPQGATYVFVEDTVRPTKPTKPTKRTGVFKPYRGAKSKAKHP